MNRSRPRFDVIGQLGSLRRYARSLTHDGADAEDLVHDALVRAYERRRTFRHGGNLRAWLLSIFHNTFVDGARSRKSEAARVELTLLAPDLVEAILDGKQPRAMQLQPLVRGFPVEW